jgi:S1-C subfamily serine protease
MAHPEDPTKPLPTPADSPNGAEAAASRAAAEVAARRADAEVAAAVQIAAAALARAADANAAVARAADPGAGLALRPDTDAAALAAPDAVTLQKVIYNATPGAQSDAGAGAEADPDTQTSSAPTAADADAAGETSTGKRPLLRTRTAGVLIGSAAALVIAFGGGGFALGAALASTDAQTSSSTTVVPDTTDSGSATIPDGSTAPDGSGFAPTTPFGGSDGSSGGTGSGSSTDASLDVVPASDEQTEGVVTIVSTLYYDEATQAAGTGVILTSDGQILTNNHVIDGATSIEVTDESTGETYSATVVGSDATNDIALLQLDDARGLDASSTDDSAAEVGAEATSIGNAEGTGDLVAAGGVITAVDESITVGNEYTGAEESLSGLIEINADVVSGDSGGPLINTDGDVIGIVTAASSGSTDITGFAIPITTALDIVEQIESGVETDTVQIGASAFLGVQIATTQQSAGVAVGGVIAGTPAATAGLAAGDVITAVDGAAVTTADGLSATIATYESGDSIQISYTDAAGTVQQATVTLTDGPA